MSEIRRPRPSRGVMGYVAELQQFDPVPAYVYDLSAPVEPTTQPLSATPEPSPRTPGVSHIRQVPKRGRGNLVIATAVLAILAGAGLGYAALGGAPDSAQAGKPGPAVSGTTAGDLLRLDPALPGVDPVTGRPSTSPAATTATPGQDPVPARPADVPAPADATRPVVPGRPGTAAPTAAAPESSLLPPVAPADPDPALVAPAPRPLTATFTHVADLTESGILGYEGTVRIGNPGARPVADWRVSLTVPGGNPVNGSGATVTQDGEAVTFTPAPGAEAVPAGGSVTFSFTVQGLLPALPAGCMIGTDTCG